MSASDRSTLVALLLISALLMLLIFHATYFIGSGRSVAMLIVVLVTAIHAFAYRL